MQIRKLTTAAERYEAALISMTAFHMRMENPQETRNAAEKETVENWGAFNEDGVMMAHIINNRYQTYLNGQLVENGGIGAVSTLPEYRNTGAIREIFSALLPEARKNGEVISTLYPFSHSFYRKFGYETVIRGSEYEFSPAVLRDYRFHGQAEMWQPGTKAEEYAAVFSRFSRELNLSMARTEEQMLARLKSEPLKDRQFAYLLREDQEPVAYLIFQDIRHDPAPILAVKDLAWNGRVGFDALLGFLGRFTADYGLIRLPLPQGINLLSLIHSPGAYEIKVTPCQNYMIRPVHVPRLLSTLRVPEGRAVRFSVRDDIIQENNGCWEVSASGVNATEDVPDLRVSVQALGQMACGAVDFAEVCLRPDVEICSVREMLASLFIRKPIWVSEQF